jgi:hypothetical protein
MREKEVSSTGGHHKDTMSLRKLGKMLVPVLGVSGRRETPRYVQQYEEVLTYSILPAAARCRE